MAVTFYGTAVISVRSLHFTLRDRIFFGFLAPVTWPWPDDLHKRTQPVSPGLPYARKWTYVKAFESYHKGGECVHLVMRGHFRPRDKDKRHTIRSAVVKNPMQHANVMALFYRTGVVGDRSLRCGNRDFGRFRLLWPWPWPDDLHIRTWPVLPSLELYRMCKYLNSYSADSS